MDSRRGRLGSFSERRIIDSTRAEEAASPRRAPTKINAGRGLVFAPKDDDEYVRGTGAPAPGPLPPLPQQGGPPVETTVGAKELAAEEEFARMLAALRA